MNPRYLAYARVHGREGEAQLAHDKEFWPGGCMVGFMIWIRRQWQAWWETQRGPNDPKRYFDACLTNADHDAFDAWLLGVSPCAGCDLCVKDSLPGR